MLDTAESSQALATARAVLDGRRIAVLTGAGISTDSGIPDYRGPQSPARKPMTYQQFVSGPQARQRYWARAHIGWSRMSAADPNPGHRAVHAMESDGRLCGLITQNVDGLHEAAGQQDLIALHGRIADVICLGCGDRTPRSQLHTRLERLNPGYAERDVAIAPDGDAQLEYVGDFVVADCVACGGVLKPDVVFFGENVPRPRVALAYSVVDAADALLVAGTSLHVLSGLRFVRHAAKASKPIVIVNHGTTRGDELAYVKVDGGCSTVLSALR